MPEITRLKAYSHEVPFWLVHFDDPEFDLFSGLMPLSGDWYFTFEEGYSLERLLTAAGHDVSKIDYATPQEWFNLHSDLIRTGGGAVWSYEDDSLAGFPIFHEEALWKVKARLSLRNRGD